MYTVGTGGIRATSGGALPTKFISSGQAFFIEAISSGNLILSNEIRNAGKGEPFFKKPFDKSHFDKGSIWLNLESEKGVFSQILIGFKPGATPSFDPLYDGLRFSGNVYADFYSILDTLSLAIRGEPSFRGDERIPLGLRIKSSGFDPLKIRIDSLTGRLHNTEIHLLDHMTGLRHDLKKGPYSFLNSETGVINDRFTLLFGGLPLQEDASVNEGANELVCFFERGNLRVRTQNNDLIIRLEVFDLLGRSVAALHPRKRIVDVEASNLASNSIYVVRALLGNQESLSKKVVHVWP
jgi:hypothetical protein